MNRQISPEVRAHVTHEELIAAALYGDLDALERYIAQGDALDLMHVNETALTRAARSGCAPFVKRLLEAGATPCTPDGWNDTALHRAVSWGKTEVVRILLDHPIVASFIDQLDHDSKSALYYAARKFRPDLVGWMLDAGAGGRREAAQALVTFNGHGQGAAATLQAFVAREADARAFLSDFDSAGRSLLHLAAAYGSSELVSFILDQGVPVDLVDGTKPEKTTPLHFACACGNTACIRTLAARGATSDRPCGLGYTPLTQVCNFAPPEFAGASVGVLLELGCDPGEADRYGNTPRALALRQGNHDVLGLIDAHTARSAMARTIRTGCRAADA